MWTLLLIVLGTHADIPVVMEFYNKGACIEAQKQIEKKFNVHTVCVYQGE